jgi:predicted phosphodiesterase
MRIAVVSDVHSNLAALQAVLQDAQAQQALDAVWSLGDCVGYGPQPNEVLGLLCQQPFVGVAGNHDLAVTGAIDTREFNPDAAAAAAWNAAALTEQSRDLLRAVPEVTAAGDGGFVLCHGSLRDPVWEYLITEEAARAQFALMTAPCSFVGHTHIPLVIEEQPGDRIAGGRPENGARLELRERRLILNPGGVGQPRDGDPRAAYAVLDTDERTVQFRRVEYPIRETQERMAAAGLPPRLIARLAVGR